MVVVVKSRVDVTNGGSVSVFFVVADAVVFGLIVAVVIVAVVVVVVTIVASLLVVVVVAVVVDVVVVAVVVLVVVTAAVVEGSSIGSVDGERAVVWISIGTVTFADVDGDEGSNRSMP